MTDAQRHSPMLEARDITLKFGGVTALANISIDIGHQELVALIGPNGAGKSSLLNVLSGFTAPAKVLCVLRARTSGAGRCTVWRKQAWPVLSRAHTCCLT